MENIRKKFGLVVRKVRTEKKISQEELAELTRLHRTYISEVERGIRNVSLVNIGKIASALNIHISELFQMVEQEENDT